MKRVIVLSTLLVFQLNSSFTLAEVFQIHRTRPQALSGWQNGVDFFRIPSSLCGSSDYECSVFNALSGAQGCNCTCPGEKSTFTLFENQWSCIENNDVRSNLQSQQYSKPGEKGNWTKYLLYLAPFCSKEIDSQLASQLKSRSHAHPLDEASLNSHVKHLNLSFHTNYFFVLFYCFIFTLFCFAP